MFVGRQTWCSPLQLLHGRCCSSSWTSPFCGRVQLLSSLPAFCCSVAFQLCLALFHVGHPPPVGLLYRNALFHSTVTAVSVAFKRGCFLRSEPYALLAAGTYHVSMLYRHGPSDNEPNVGTHANGKSARTLQRLPLDDCDALETYSALREGKRPAWSGLWCLCYFLMALAKATKA
jgi:hypothetical protein